MSEHVRNEAIDRDFRVCTHINFLVQDSSDRSEISFTPIGLLEMFNTGGAVEQFEFQKTPKSDENIGSLPAATITLKVRRCGQFGTYCSQRPLKCIVGNMVIEFNYEAATGFVTLTVPVPEEEMYRWTIEFQV